MTSTFARLVAIVVLAPAVLACGRAEPRAAVSAVGASSSAATQEPTVDAAAFKGRGRLAFLWDGSLYVLDGDASPRPSLRVVDGSGKAAAPSWSSDGDWLAYLYMRDPKRRVGTLRIKSADGKRSKTVRGLPGRPGQLAWSPTSPVLAVTVAGPDGFSRELWVVGPGRKPRKLARVEEGIFSLAWRPDGKALAYTGTLPFANPPQGRSDALYTTAGPARARRLGRRPLQLG